ncbi:M20 family metallopeptidase [Microvirga antarctica]|uniref:M20 family metallopeptidase n=1 Tax=Microvirga antarctica TaxID=2819233 RepID=UPI001B30A23F|nr:M20 family metallopeptidase [Microvirga antarctica]
MDRANAISSAERYFDSGAFQERLTRLVSLPTESQDSNRADTLQRYLESEIRPWLETLGFTCTILPHPRAKSSFLFAERIEHAGYPTVFGYGHGDVVRGMESAWREGLSPWTVTCVGDRWYGRGTADNKGQHALCIAALQSVLEVRGKLGFNAKFLIEMGEEVGSPGLRELCTDHHHRFQADVLIASDGPRLTADRPTIFLGTRGVATFDLSIVARDGGHHSGNWGGVLSDPAIQLAHAMSTITSPTGRIAVAEWRPDGIPDSVRAVLKDFKIDSGPDGPIMDPEWGEPGLTPEEQVFGWCSFDVLAMRAGNPETPVNAVPPDAWARCQLRFVKGIDPEQIVPALRRHLARHGWSGVTVEEVEEMSLATRLDPADPWVTWAAGSIARTTGKDPAILPNLGGTLPNDIFADVLGLPTIWVPHSYPGCQQHGPDEHLLAPLAREGLAIMAGLYWDLGSRP